MGRSAKWKLVLAFYPSVVQSMVANRLGITEVADLEKEIAAFEGMQPSLEAASFGQWALVHDEELVGTYDTFDGAAGNAVKKFGRGPYLIRQIGSPPITLPASVMFTFQHG